MVNATENRPTAPAVLTSVAALAGATLLLEGALLRLLAVAQFYHFAFLVVSLALLGFGASGTALALSSRLRGLPLNRLLSLTGLSFFLATGLAYLAVNLLPFDSYRIAWEPRQLLYFGLFYLALSLPFFCSGLGIGGALAASAGSSHRVYAANLLGSALGALLSLLGLAVAGVPGAVLLAGLIGLVPAVTGPGRRWVIVLYLIATAGLGALAIANFQRTAPLGMVISPYKGLAYARQYPGASLPFGAWNATSRVDVVSAAGIRQLPGLSYTFPGSPPDQLGLSVDAETPQPITLARPQDLTAASYLPESVAFFLQPGGEALVLQPGGGLGVLQALAAGSNQVTAVVGNGLIPRAVARVAPAWDAYAEARVDTIVETPRVFLAGDKTRYPLVFVPLTDAYRPVTSGAYSLSETYDLTVEAFEAMLARLQPDGVLVITRWVQSPPSEEIRLVASLAEALSQQDLVPPAQALVAYQGIQTFTVLAKPDGWTPEQLAQVRQFAEQRRFDLVWAPDIEPQETNRFNRQPEPLAYLALHALLTGDDPEAVLTGYPFAVEPATDNRPFFYHFFRWRQTPEILATLGQTWQPFGGSGYLILLALLALVVVLSGILILAPLAAQRFWSRPAGTGGVQETRTPGLGWRTLAYFSLLGLAFLFVEIPLIQRWILILGHPSYAFTVVVLTLLVFSGLGSLLAPATWARRNRASAALLALAFLTPWLIDVLAPAILALPVVLRASLGSLTLAPLAILMGMPFPWGLAWLERAAPSLVPWAWAVNGCASVIASVLAAMLALSFGFNLVLLLGAIAYGLAWAVLASAQRLTPASLTGAGRRTPLSAP